MNPARALVLWFALAVTGCRPSPAAPTGSASAHPWRLLVDSPFSLVGESLYDVRVADLGGTPVIVHAACSDFPWPQGAHSYSLRPLVGDQVSADVIPASPVNEPVIKLLGVWGRYPNDVWLAYDQAPQPHRRLLQWNGARWREVPAPSTPMLDTSFDWYDSAKLITRKLDFSDAEPGQPFLFGQSGHPAPSFSGLKFPPTSPDDSTQSEVEFATLPSHELFLLHSLEWPAKHRTIVSLARSTAPAQGSVRELETGESVSAHLASGTLRGRAVVVALGDAVVGDEHTAFAYVADAESIAKLPALEPPSSPDAAGMWLAGDRLWARRGSTIFRTDGASWQKFAECPPSDDVYSARDGGLWSSSGARIFRFDEQGRAREVPFMTESSQESVIGVGLLPLSDDDVFVVAQSRDDESFLFRSKPMRSVLSCVEPRSR
ncbi:MAG: hypothetical protein QM756_25745 [Polyangiaceae bacterium]